ncbi:MAG: hypothetical protein MJY60_01995 [Bacteroidales bacterium]|nr:hypothetical protein [Bacteroidales bacterium]
MKKFILIIITTIVTSCLVFPFSFTFFPSQNTKNLMAIIGIVLYAFNLINKRRIETEKGNILVFIGAFAVAFMALFTMIYHNTSDDTYVSFPITLVLWLAAAYTCIRMVKATHEYASVELITCYLTAVAVLQCITAELISNIPAFENWVCSWMHGGEIFFKKSGRMYGIGCALDVAGVRFSAILIMLAHLCCTASAERKNKKLLLLLICYAAITVVGNMISRTTLVGAALGIGMWILITLIPERGANANISRLWGRLLLTVFLAFGICTVLYNTNYKVREDLRFGFEGFFSIAEKGHWETHSNNELEKMVKWPDNTATWILGDGYMADPTAVEDYLISFKASGDYVYMGTDIGYCRFIFYFGIVGLAVMIIYFAIIAAACAARAPSKGLAYFFLFVVTLVVWAKVTTDPFAVMCLFLLTDIETDEDEKEDEDEDEDEEDEYENRILHTLSV